MLWEVDIYPAAGQPDAAARRGAAEAPDLGLDPALAVAGARGYLGQGKFDRAQIARLVRELLADEVVERWIVAPVGDSLLSQPPDSSSADFGGGARPIHVLPKPG